MVSLGTRLATPRAWARRRARFARRYGEWLAERSSPADRPLVVVDAMDGHPRFDCPDGAERLTPAGDDLLLVACPGPEFHQTVPTMLARVGGRTSLWLVPAAGPPDTPLDVVARVVADKRANTDVLIGLDLASLCASADSLHARPRSVVEERAARSAVDRVSSVLGTDDWKANYGPGSHAARRERVLLDHYASTLRTLGLTVAVHNIEALRHRSGTGVVFCTRQPGTIPVANDVLRDVEDGTVRDAFSEDTPGLFDDFLDLVPGLVRSRRVALFELLAEALPAGGRTCLTDLRRRFTLERFGDFDLEDYHAAVEALRLEGIARPSHEGPAIDADEAIEFLPLAARPERTGKR